MKNEALLVGDRVEVYRNLHKNCFSVRKNGRVVKHIPDDQGLTLVDVKFAVQPAGRAKVLRERKKNVHAFVRGTVAADPLTKIVQEYTGAPFAVALDSCTNAERYIFVLAYQLMVSYNPFEMDTFFTTLGGNKTPIKTARLASLRYGKVFVNPSLRGKAYVRL